jgi:hypothetical protein
VAAGNFTMPDFRVATLSIDAGMAKPPTAGKPSDRQSLIDSRLGSR